MTTLAISYDRLIGDPLFGFDGLSARLAAFVVLRQAALVAALPRRQAKPAMLGALLATGAIELLLVTSRNFLVFTLCLGASFIPTALLVRSAQPFAARSRALRSLLSLGLFCTLPLVAAAVLIALGCRAEGSQLSFSLLNLSVPRGGGAELSVAALLLFSLLLRSAALPLAPLFVELVEAAPLAAAAQLLVSPAGAYLFLRVLPPFFPHVHERAIALVAGISLFSAALAALLSLVQKSLRGVIGWLAVSQSGLVLVGLCAGETEGVTGALLQSLASGLGITGLVAGLIMLEARTGTSDLASLSGLCQRRPHLAGLFLLLGTAVLGIPGSLGFLADDMLVHGPLREHPVLSCGVLGVTVLSGAAFLRAYVRAFFGPALPGAAAPDLLLRERAVLLTLIDALFGFGLFPSTIL